MSRPRGLTSDSKTDSWRSSTARSIYPRRLDRFPSDTTCACHSAPLSRRAAKVQPILKDAVNVAVFETLGRERERASGYPADDSVAQELMVRRA
jgi:hypothetical protein